MTTTSARFKQKIDTYSVWQNSTLVLEPGEFAISSDTNYARVGDGNQTWSNLTPLNIKPHSLERYQDVDFQNPVVTAWVPIVYMGPVWQWRSGPPIVYIDPVTSAYNYSIDVFNDVDISTTSLVSGDILSWDVVNTQFINKEVVLEKITTVAPPNLSTDTGEEGEIRFGAGYLYICIAINTWKRAALSTW